MMSPSIAHPHPSFSCQPPSSRPVAASSCLERAIKQRGAAQRRQITHTHTHTYCAAGRVLRPSVWKPDDLKHQAAWKQQLVLCFCRREEQVEPSKKGRRSVLFCFVFFAELLGGMLAPRALRSLLLCALSCACGLRSGAASRHKPHAALPIQSEREPLPSKGLAGRWSCACTGFWHLVVAKDR